MDSKRHLLPQRRNRVYGVASLVTPWGDAKAITKQKWVECWDDLKTNAQFPMEMMFEDKPIETLKDGRHTCLVDRAQRASVGSSANLFVDCNSSTRRLTYADGAIPCITPTHPVWSCKLRRYLSSKDLLNAQGLWASTMSASTYQHVLANDTFARDLAGNSFSSTVVQCALLASFVTCGASWKTTTTVSPITTSLKRVFGKKPPPKGYPVVKPDQNDKKIKKVRKKTLKYVRKVSGVDSRQWNTGKKVGSTIFEKEKVTGP